MRKGVLKEIIIVFAAMALIMVLVMQNNVLQDDMYRPEIIRIGTASNMRPYCYRNDSGTLTGFNVDAMTAVALELGVSIEWLELDEGDDVLHLLESGAVDCIMGFNPETLGLTDGVVQSKPFTENKISIFIKKHDPKIKSFEDLKYKKVSVYREDPMVRDIDSIEGIRVFKTDTVEAAVALLINGMAEAYIGDKLVSTEYITNSEYKNNVKLIGDRSCNWITSLLSTEKNRRIIEVIEQGMSTISKQNTLDKVKIKWFGQYIDESAVNLKKFIAVVVVAVLSVGLVFAVFYRINNLLRKQVKERTEIINEEKILKEEIINSLFDGVLFVDAEGRVILENTAARNILSEKESMINKDIRTLKAAEYIRTDDIFGAARDRIKLVLQETAVTDGREEKYIQYNLAPVMRGDNEIRGITISFRDVTEEKKMMKKLISRDKMESLGRLTAGIAHEIRNPLTSISMYVELLSEKIDKESFRRQIMEDIPREIDRLNDILINLLDYAKPSPPHKEVFNMCDDVRFVLRLLNSQIKKNKVRLVEMVDDQIDIYFDRQQFKQIMINLIINAADAVGNVLSPLIEIRGYEGDDHTVIEVADNGSGIPDDVKQRIFEPFFSTKSDSYGLGLSIVDQLVKENDSEIYVVDNFPSGSSFGIRIAKQKVYNSDKRGDLYEEDVYSR